MGMKQAVKLKVFVDKKKKKVIFAEADQDFVEILFSFFTLPLGTIATLTSKQLHANDTKLRSLNSLHECVKNLDIKHFNGRFSKLGLQDPFSSLNYLLKNLKINLHDTDPIDALVSDSSHGDGDTEFLKGNGSFIITDELKVMPVMFDSSIAHLNSLGVEYINLLQERTMDFGFEEFSSLLRWSLLTNNPLTNMVLGESKPSSCSCSCHIKSSTSMNTLPLIRSDFAPRFNLILLLQKLIKKKACHKVKLLVQKSKKKVLCAQVERFFVEMLLSFLTIPLGNVKRLTMDSSSSSSTGVDNLYNSISSLGDGNYLKSEKIKTMLLCPMVDAIFYPRVTDLLPIYDEYANAGSFLKKQAMFIVSDDLEITFSSCISTISKFNSLGVSNGDIEVVEISIGEQEALLILKAFLTSSSVLTDCLNAFGKGSN